MKRWIALPAAMLLLALVIVGCGSSSSSSSSEDTSAPESAEGTTGEGKEAEPKKTDVQVTYISPVAAEPAQQQVNLGLELGAKELGWSESVLDSAISADRQVSNVETAINRGDAAIASWTLDPNAIAGAYEMAQAKNIPVIGVNSEGIGITSSVWWEVQLCEPGGPQAVTAEKIAEIHPHAKTIMIGQNAAKSLRELAECFAKEAKKAGLDVINETNNEADSAAGSQKVFEPLLTKYPDVEAVWCYNDESALGVSAALLAGGKTIATTEDSEGVVVTGESGNKGAIEAVEEGRLSWTWDPDNIAVGYAAVKAMKEAMEGIKPEKMVIESDLVDGETVGDYVQPEEREFTLENLPLKE